MEQLVFSMQERLCQAFTQVNGTGFGADHWTRPDGSQGCTRVLQEGAVFEKIGVDATVMYGTMSPAMLQAATGHAPTTDDAPTFAMASLSLIVHPHNPMVPTTHANYRYFEFGDGRAPGSWWFGGGADLTPAYLFDADVRHFHQTHKQVCDQYDPTFYPRFKQECDEYFYLPHRGEHRGVGGIRFDTLHEQPADKLYAFVTDCAEAFLPAYLPIVEQRRDLPWTAEQKRWQQLRQGRYVEFNLIYDRGVVFGLKGGVNVEAILTSLPLIANWEYDFQPQPETAEAHMLAVLRQPIAWA